MGCSQYHWTIVEILSAFIREKCSLNAIDISSKILEEQSREKNKTSNKVSVDIQAALTVLGRRKTEQDPEEKKLI